MERLAKRYNIVIYFALPVLMYLFLFSGCTKNIIKKETDLLNLNNERISFLLKKIEDINNNSPKSFSLDLNTQGILNRKKFKSTGKAIFNKEPREMKITFYDVIFRSPLTIIVQDIDVIKFYFPIEKTLYMDNVKTVNLKRYSNINLDYNLVASLAIGKIPIIKNYSIKKALTTGENEQNSRKETYLIFENNDFFETIAFEKDIPCKILMLNKRSKEKTEIYLKEPFYKNSILFYKTIRFISLSSDFRITTRFKNIKFNIPVDVKKITKIDLPKDCKILYMK